jgi:hypothetical protein
LASRLKQVYVLLFPLEKQTLLSRNIKSLNSHEKKSVILFTAFFVTAVAGTN